MFGLDHTTGIMSIGYANMHKAFITIEPKANTLNEFVAVNYNELEKNPTFNPVWDPNDSIKLSKHFCFNILKIKYEFEISNGNKIVNYDFSDIWFEGNFRFNFVKTENDEVFLFDPSRKYYLRITSDKVFLGLGNINDINMFLYNGKWTTAKPN